MRVFALHGLAWPARGGLDAMDAVASAGRMESMEQPSEHARTYTGKRQDMDMAR